MKKIILVLSIVSILYSAATGQNDPEAIKILDRFSSQALSAPSVSMRFDLITTDQTTETKNTITGSVIFDGDKYRLDLKENIIWFNGTTIWSYLPTENEVTITRPDKKDNSFQSRPSSLFTMYKSGYRNRLIEERSDSWIIDMYPDDIKSDHIRVRLKIGKSALQLISAEYRKKDGITATLEVEEYNLKMKPESSAFIFSPEKYKGVEVIDMR